MGPTNGQDLILLLKDDAATLIHDLFCMYYFVTCVPVLDQLEVGDQANATKGWLRRRETKKFSGEKISLELRSNRSLSYLSVHYLRSYMC